MAFRSADPPTPIDEAEAQERERIRRVYDSYAASARHRRIWSSDTVASRFLLDSKWARIGALLREARFDPGAGMSLDIGAGGGDDCSRIRGLDVSQDRIVGMDLLARRLTHSRQTHPWLAVVQGDARRLPFRSGSLALVYQSTMLSSVLDGALRRVILSEVGRVLRPGGFFLSFDTRYPNPWNPHTRPVPAAELRNAFAGWRLWVRSANGIPQLIRLLAPVSLALCRAVESLPFLRSHLLVLARKPDS